MSLRIFVPRDAGAVAVGADEVALALEMAASKVDVEIEIVRNGSRGGSYQRSDLQPFSAIAPYGDAAASHVAQWLDTEVLSLLQHATGIPAT